jgi:hypothetical protein
MKYHKSKEMEKDMNEYCTNEILESIIHIADNNEEDIYS